MSPASSWSICSQHQDQRLGSRSWLVASIFTIPPPFDIEVNVSVNRRDTLPHNHRRTPPTPVESYHRIYPLVFSRDLIRRRWTLSPADNANQLIFLLTCFNFGSGWY
ncbi:hypothetical protein CDAR_214181 [Caerostris darwini]|uniref:Uncharacterized protein n=1 Tax=Caerostris darwini TaxID=1538125 RepID=A0AAV4S559_9ARAC|nr:hypothetical protein CDAR_214181 [Caerostris darwini]